MKIKLFQLFILLRFMTGFAEEAVDASLKREEEAIPAWLARWEIARVLSYQKKYEESIQEYLILLREKPELVEARLEMARIYFYKGDKAGSLSILEAIPINQWDDATKALIANFYASEKKYELAESLYKDYLSRHPDDLKIRLKYADMLSWQKRYKESILQYKELLAARPQDHQLRRKYAFVLIWMGNHDEGIKELRQTLDNR